MAKKVKGKKSFLKKTGTKLAIIFTIATGAFALTYKTVPQVKEKVDEIVQDIRAPFNKLEELAAVQNIEYNEADGLLTFDEVPNASGYEITVRNHTSDSEYLKKSLTVTVDLNFPDDFRTGDDVTLTITAEGDYQSYRNSKAATYTHTVLLADAKMYEEINDYLINFLISQMLTENGIMRVNNFTLDAMYRKDNHFYFEGKGVSNDKRPLNYKLEFDFSKYANELPLDFSIPKNYMSLAYIIKKDSYRSMTFTAEYADSYHDFKDVLEENGAFDEYIEQGYNIEVLKFENSDLISKGENVAVEYRAIYKATHAEKPDVIFEQKHIIETKNNEGQINNFDDFITALENGEKIKLSEVSKDVFDQVMNEQLNNILEAGKAEKVEERTFG